MKKKKALITGITGQDGSYLAELLLQKNYMVYGIMRRSSAFNTDRIDHLLNNENLILHHGDLTDGTNISKVIREVKPDECYNLGAQSHVQISFFVPEYSANVDGLGAIRLLDAIKTFCPTCRYYQASTSEQYGNVGQSPQNEQTPFYPRSPYAVAKIYAYWITINYREAYNIFACNGILFNHESERRTPNFVTRKITTAVAKILVGKQQTLLLGNLDAKRDWGYAKEYVEGMWLMLQQDTADDFVLATGETHTVEEFCYEAFKAGGLSLKFFGSGKDRKGIDENGVVRVAVDSKYFRPTDVDILIGDTTKAKIELGWESRTKFKDLVRMMVKHDISLYTDK